MNGACRPGGLPHDVRYEMYNVMPSDDDVMTERFPLSSIGPS